MRLCMHMGMIVSGWQRLEQLALAREVARVPETATDVTHAFAEAVGWEELGPREVLGGECHLLHPLQAKVHLARTLIAAQSTQHAPGGTDVAGAE